MDLIRSCPVDIHLSTHASWPSKGLLSNSSAILLKRPGMFIFKPDLAETREGILLLQDESPVDLWVGSHGSDDCVGVVILILDITSAHEI